MVQDWIKKTFGEKYPPSSNLSAPVPETTYSVESVYGVNRDLPLNYVERGRVDPIFRDTLKRDKHVIVYGSSKQGKTSLRKRWLPDNDYIVVSCLNTMSPSDLNGAILKAAGYSVEQTSTKTSTGHLKVHAEFKGRGKVPLIAEGEIGGGGETGRQRGSEIVHKRLELDLQDVNDVVAGLQEVDFDKIIALEDFHYLPVDTQRSFAFALKAFHENSAITFMVVGVWREKNRLVYYNGDLTNRVVSIDADEWSRAELSDVISAGEVLLNIKFDLTFRNKLLDSCFDAVYLVQEACLKACQLASVTQTCPDLCTVGRGIDAKELIKGIVDEQAGRYGAFATNFAEGFQKTGLEMYKWVLFAVISASHEELERGLRRQEVSAAIKSRHPEGASLNEGNITQALQNTASLQVLKSVRPIILDYDQTTKVIYVVDRSFLIWLAYQDRAEILTDLDIILA